jgi:mannose-6-phosphate isomerase-like protein (cupin superfamily)
MAGVVVIDSNRSMSSDAVGVQPTVGSGTGFDPLEQAVIVLAAGALAELPAGGDEHTLFCLTGRGSIQVGEHVHELEPEVGITLAPGMLGELRNTGSEELRLVSVRIPEPVAGDGAPGGVAVARVGDQEMESATTDREFRIVADPESGLRSATHFVGYIPTKTAPNHFHLYDEVIYVLEGEGVMYAGESSSPVFPGACIQLPARTVHCLDNTGSDPMRVVAVFRPAGSPAAAFYPDGTPAYPGIDPVPTPEEE